MFIFLSLFSIFLKLFGAIFLIAVFLTTGKQISGVLPKSEVEILLGSAKTDFVADMKAGVNTRGGNDNPYYRMADLPEPEFGYPRN